MHIIISYKNHYNNAYYGAKLLRLACNSYNIIFMVLAQWIETLNIIDYQYYY